MSKQQDDFTIDRLTGRSFLIQKKMEFEKKCNMSEMWRPKMPEGLDLEIIHHPLTMKQVVNLIVALGRLKGNKQELVLSTEFRDEQLLDIMLESIVEEEVVFERSAVPPPQFVCLSEEQYSVTDTEKRSLILVENSMELHAVMLQGGAESRKVHLNMSTYRNQPPTPQAEIVALGIKGTKYYLSCHMRDNEPALHLETVDNKENLKTINSDSDMVRFLFYKQDSALDVSTLVSVRYSDWYISTAEENNKPVAMCLEKLRKQKLMEYLAAKGKLKLPNPKPYFRDDKKPETSALLIVKGKENKAPTDISRYECTKVPTLAVQSTKHPARRAFGVTNKVNIKSSILTGRQDASRPSVTNGPEQPKLDQNPGLARTYTIVSFKSNQSSASYLKKQQNTGIRSSGRASTNTAHTAVTKSNSRFSSSSNFALSSAKTKTLSVRMSLGPLVKTKTGLIPAVIQQKERKNVKKESCQNLIQTSTTAADTTTPATLVSNKLRSSSTSSVSVSQRSKMVQRKTLPATSLNNPVNKKTTVSLAAKAGIKSQEQNRCTSKPLLGKQSQLSCNSQLPGRPKSMSRSSKCTAATIKPEGRAGVSKTNKSAGQPTDRPTKQRTAGEGGAGSQPCKVSLRTSSVPASRCSSRALSLVIHAAVAEQGGKTKTCKERDSKKGHRSENAPPPQTGIKKTGAPVVSQTVPRSARTIGRTGQTTDTKTPNFPVRVIPQTEAKKLTAAQEERMKKLEEWRKAKGISYKRPPMPVKPQVRRTAALHQPFWASMKEEDDAHSLICAVDRSLADCIKLLGEGCPADQVKEVLSRLPPVSHKFAKYWICQARLMEKEGNLDVLPMFEKAVGVVLEPVDELRTVVFEILKKKDEIQASEVNENEVEQSPTNESTPESFSNPMKTPNPVRALICGEKGDSSIIKYKITATPGGPPSQRREPALVNGQEVRFFTPVRRSVRIERASLRYPVSLQDHDLCVASYNDLISEEDNEKSEEQKVGETSPSTNNTPMYVYRQNEALKDKVLVQLVCDEGVYS
ncbi:hypothetical protein L3Q82_023034 [Scortum barcoo]|uniref:Uncharacterized protein n=1 Tax=Scortum barcoo TaxID=214431 RepID=A0ACB8WY28_9TELE|nr:hypothetical protein L3Q82_023034 [Scortum barcoo]